MFDRASSFDRTLFDRTQEDRHVNAFIQARGDIDARIQIELFTNSFNLPGHGDLALSLIVRQFIQGGLTGDGDMGIADFLLLDMVSGDLSGHGDAEFELLAISPIGNLSMDGVGELHELTLFFFQHMGSIIRADGDLEMSLVLIKQIGIPTMEGYGEMSVDNQFALQMPIAVSLSGHGEMTLRRIGALNVEVLEFNNLNLRPGQTMIIDTDELNVFIDNILNVTSVTEDSVFFQLKPGENDITFRTNGNLNLQVTVVWQNRWL